MRAPVSSHHPVANKAQPEPVPAKLPLDWEEWGPLFEQSVQPLTARLLALAEISEGQQVLDLAVGAGELALNAAQLVGTTGEVIALDASADLLAVARNRAGLTNLTFLEQASDGLDFPAESFEAAFCRWGLTSTEDLPKTLRRVSNALKPGGHFAAAVWGASPKVPLLSLPGAVIAQSLRLPPRPGDPSFSLANRHALAHAFGQAGFGKVRSEVLTITVSFAGAASYTRYLQAASPYLVAMLADLPTEKRETLWQAVGQAADRRYGGPDGLLRIPGETICVVGQKPT